MRDESPAAEIYIRRKKTDGEVPDYVRLGKRVLENKII
jgi:hypothetical protein